MTQPMVHIARKSNFRNASTVAGSTKMTDVTLSTDATLSTGWSAVRSRAGKSHRVKRVIPAGSEIPTYNSAISFESKTLDISKGARNKQQYRFRLSGKVDKYCGSIYDSNRNVKILKYYSGATLEGTVSLDGIGPVRMLILIERDAFSGEEIEVDGHVVDEIRERTGYPSVALRQIKTDSSHSKYQQERSGYPPSPANQSRVSQNIADDWIGLLHARTIRGELPE